ncbi:hypothetical protein C8R45DRAFT_991087 [Mycena sanguinolenta]|nr:hypothetical protein C8R45DRAFT_991087 [Mycena sanguinolenta]
MRTSTRHAVLRRVFILRHHICHRPCQRANYCIFYNCPQTGTASGTRRKDGGERLLRLQRWESWTASGRRGKERVVPSASCSSDNPHAGSRLRRRRHHGDCTSDAGWGASCCGRARPCGRACFISFPFCFVSFPVFLGVFLCLAFSVSISCPLFLLPPCFLRASFASLVPFLSSLSCLAFLFATGTTVPGAESRAAVAIRMGWGWGARSLPGCGTHFGNGPVRGFADFFGRLGKEAWRGGRDPIPSHFSAQRRSVTLARPAVSCPVLSVSLVYILDVASISRFYSNLILSYHVCCLSFPPSLHIAGAIHVPGEIERHHRCARRIGSASFFDGRFSVPPPSFLFFPLFWYLPWFQGSGEARFLSSTPHRRAVLVLGVLRPVLSIPRSQSRSRSRDRERRGDDGVRVEGRGIVP